MNPQDLIELVNLIQNGGNPDRAYFLAQVYADWQKNLAKQQVQNRINQFSSCKNVQEVDDLIKQLTSSASPHMAEHIKHLGMKRFSELINVQNIP